MAATSTLPSDATFAYDGEIPQLAIYTVNEPLAEATRAPVQARSGEAMILPTDTISQQAALRPLWFLCTHRSLVCGYDRGMESH